MASNLTPAFAYTVLYVKDVTRSVAFYAKAFGYSVRRLDESHRHPSPAVSDQPVEVCFAYQDVDTAYKRAVENGAEAVSEPEDKEWGQKVGYVRDIDGIVVRLGSYVQAPKKD
ncbi:hypothetical protein Patl1_30885 [Pistacia atlantica]|uniref:Uncharacterized protein n=1 Tax=Pistacia atlantica TaxID=434234 RepID=A0ACC1ACN2_9ROSI|nr:hypothetical protein Patl1_30885 [Pistacia atlantica]